MFSNKDKQLETLLRKATSFLLSQIYQPNKRKDPEDIQLKDDLFTVEVPPTISANLKVVDFDKEKKTCSICFIFNSDNSKANIKCRDQLVGLLKNKCITDEVNKNEKVTYYYVIAKDVQATPFAIRELLNKSFTPSINRSLLTMSYRDVSDAANDFETGVQSEKNNASTGGEKKQKHEVVDMTDANANKPPFGISKNI